MKYQLVAIDIDDTLITSDKRVTERTQKALAAAIELGVVVTLATGRMFASAQQIAKQIHLNVPIITYQGSMVKNLMDQQIIYERHVPFETSKFLFDYCKKKQFHLQGYYMDELYTREDNDRIKKYASLSDVPYKIEPDFHRLTAYPMTKLLIYDEPDILDKIALELKPLIGEQVHITKSKPFYLEFTHPEGTKGHALSFLAERYQCSLNDVIAIGDSWNDAEMLKVAGLGIAMENAVPALKELADYITYSNEQDGVAHAIEKYILNK